MAPLSRAPPRPGAPRSARSGWRSRSTWAVLAVVDRGVPAARAAALPRRPPARPPLASGRLAPSWSPARPSSSRWCPATEPADRRAAPRAISASPCPSRSTRCGRLTELSLLVVLALSVASLFVRYRRATRRSAGSCSGSCWRVSSSSSRCCPGRSSPARRSPCCSRSRSCPLRSRSPCCATSCSTSGSCSPGRWPGCCSPSRPSRRTSPWSRSSTSLVSRAFGRVGVRCRSRWRSLLAPLLPRLQREVERWMYGDRRDPARVAGRLGEHLAAGDERGLQGVVGCAALGAAAPLRRGQDGDEAVLADDGEPGPSTSSASRCPTPAPASASSRSGCGPASGGLVRRWTRARSRPGGGAARLSRSRRCGSSGDLQASREPARRGARGGAAPVAPRPPRRTRAGADRRGAHRRRGRRTSSTATRSAAGSCWPDSRDHVAHGHRRRPPARRRPAPAGARRGRPGRRHPATRRPAAAAVDGSSLAVRLVAPDDLPPLPAAVEVAAYRIATEALINVARHADATSADASRSSATVRSTSR